MSNFLNSFKKNSACKTYIIAEAGVHHRCNLSEAKRIIDAAAWAGADAIKFQTYKAEMLVTNWAEKYWADEKDEDKGTQYDYFKKRDLFNYNDYLELKYYCEKANIVFLSTPFDEQSVHWLNEIEVPFWKIASADIDNFPLLKTIANTKKPIVISTGASYFKEIKETITFLINNNVDIKNIALLHCNLSYPTPDEQANLLRITELYRQFPDMIIGYSDHTIPDDSVTIPSVAVSLGAKIIEKHFTLDRTLPEDDHYHSVDPLLLFHMIKQIQLVEKSIAINKEITESEMEARQKARRSIVANDNITKGTILTERLIECKRPGGGISPSQINKLIGNKVNKNIKKDKQLRWDDLNI